MDTQAIHNSMPIELHSIELQVSNGSETDVGAIKIQRPLCARLLPFEHGAASVTLGSSRPSLRPHKRPILHLSWSTARCGFGPMCRMCPMIVELEYSR